MGSRVELRYILALSCFSFSLWPADELDAQVQGRRDVRVARHDEGLLDLPKPQGAKTAGTVDTWTHLLRSPTLCNPLRGGQATILTEDI